MSPQIPSAVLESAQYAARTAALPWVVGSRWLASAARAGALATDLAASLPARSWRATFKVAADELFFLSEYVAGTSFAFNDGTRVAREIERATRLYEQRGWLSEPRAFHGDPPPLDAVAAEQRYIGSTPYRHMSFASEYAPWPDEPGADRWHAYAANQRAHVRLFQHHDRPRPWLVCVPGYRMGGVAIDYVGFQVPWLFHELGLNVAIPVLPFHGPRASGRRGGDGYLAGDFLDTIHAQAQAVWDIRRTIRWLRSRDEQPIGIYGVSLGGYTTALLAALEDDLACAIAGIPAIDFVDLMRSNTSDLWLSVTEWLGFDWGKIHSLLRVVSPLAMPARLGRERCFMFAGIADALAPPHHAVHLWRHWGEPRIEWYQGGHVSFFLEKRVRRLLIRALRSSGLLAAPRAA